MKTIKESYPELTKFYSRLKEEYNKPEHLEDDLPDIYKELSDIFIEVSIARSINIQADP